MKRLTLTLALAFCFSAFSFAQKMKTPVLIKAADKNIDIKFSYAGPTFYDLNKDGLQDLVVGDLWGNILYFKNTGTKSKPVYTEGSPITVDGKKKIINNW